MHLSVLLEPFLLVENAVLTFAMRLKHRESALVLKPFSFIVQPMGFKWNDHPRKVRGGECLNFDATEMDWVAKAEDPHYHLLATGTRTAKKAALEVITLYNNRFLKVTAVEAR